MVIRTGLYHSKRAGLNKFSEFVHFDEVAKGKFLVKPVAEFDDSEFSDLDMQIIEDVIKQYGHLTANQLVDIVHSKDSLWKKNKTASKYSFLGAKQNKFNPNRFYGIAWRRWI